MFVGLYLCLLFFYMVVLNMGHDNASFPTSDQCVCLCVCVCVVQVLKLLTRSHYEVLIPYWKRNDSTFFSKASLLYLGTVLWVFTAPMNSGCMSRELGCECNFWIRGRRHVRVERDLPSCSLSSHQSLLLTLITVIPSFKKSTYASIQHLRAKTFSVCRRTSNTSAPWFIYARTTW